MADIVITTDFTQVNNLNTSLKSTDAIFVKTVDAVLRESNRFKRITKFLAKTTEETLKVVEKAEEIASAKLQQESLKREKARLKEAAAAEREAKRIEAAARKAADAEAKLAAEVAKNRAISAQQFTSGVNQRTGVTGSSAMQSGASFSAMDQEIERLKVKYNQIYAASRLYETSLEEINRAHMLGITSIKQHEAAVESLNAEYQSFQTGVAQAGNRFAQHVNQTSTGMNKFGVAAQQTGYQVSDFIVQVQGGTNPLVAFSQQATQLAGLLYLLPPSMQAARIGMLGFSVSMATATAGLTILIPLLAMIAMNFIGSGKESEETSKKLDRQTQAYDNLIAKIEELRLARQMEASGAQSQDEQIIMNEMNALLKERADLQRQISFQTSQDNIVASQGRSTLMADNLEAERLEKQARIDKITVTLDLLSAERQEAERINRINQIRTNQILEELAARQRLKAEHAAQVKLMGDQLAAQGRMQTAAEAVLVKYGMMRTVAAGVANELKRAADETFRMASLSYGKLQNTAGGGPDAARREVMANMPNPFGVVAGGAGGFSTPSANSTGGGSRETKLRKEISLVKELTQAEKDRQTVLQSVESSLESGFMSMVDGTKSVTDAFKSMARDIIKELYRVFVVQRMVGAISGAANMFTLPSGPSTGTLGLPKFASGGSMMGGNAYLVGEHGPELVIPRHSGSVVNANQTANALGGNSGAITVQNNITVTGSDAAMVRAEVAKMIPQITNATKAAVIDAKQRGGQMAAAFR